MLLIIYLVMKLETKMLKWKIKTCYFEEMHSFIAKVENQTISLVDTFDSK